jgi:hypothetical protein
MRILAKHRPAFWTVLGLFLAVGGCQHFARETTEVERDAPRENRNVSMTNYVIKPPDVLVVELIRAVPLPPYKIKTQDLLFIQVRGTPPEDPIKGVDRKSTRLNSSHDV